MSFFTPDNLTARTGGRWLRPPAGDVALSGVGTDTREDLIDRIFVALTGEVHDGHDHLHRAVEAGARVCIVHSEPPDLPDATGVLLVDDTRAALGRLAAAYRRTLSGTVIAITGSCGKTTVKSMTDAVLAGSRRGSAAPKSFNNDVGVPLTILAAGPDDEYLILEIGSNHPGEIGQLGEIARPDIGVITMIGHAHLEGFGGLDAVACEKASLLRHLDGERLAVINADAPNLRGRLDGAVSVVLFGEAADADPQLTGWGPAGDGWWIEVNGDRRFGLGLPGRHNAINALAAIAVGRRMGVPDDLIDRALSGCRPVEMRMSRHVVGEVTIYNDAYNANPDSVRASLESFADLAAGASRRVLVLGDMLELGESAAEQHREVGRRVIDLDRRLAVDRLVLVGSMSGYVAEPIRDQWPRERLAVLDDLDRPNAAAVAATLQPGDAVLLKGSRALGLERLIEAINEA